MKFYWHKSYYRLDINLLYTINYYELYYLISVCSFTVFYYLKKYPVAADLQLSKLPVSICNWKLRRSQLRETTYQVLLRYVKK